MERQAKFHPFTIDRSWYETYWLTEAPTNTRTPVTPPADWFRRMTTALASFPGEWVRTHMAAAAQARLHRTSLDEI